MTAEEFGQHVGRKVIFRYLHGEEEEGVITSANDHFVFVRFGTNTTSQACGAERLRLSVP
jgi:ribosomal protein L35AE/L33A